MSDNCKCVLVDGSCPACLDKINPVADLYLKAMLEFFAKIEWIAEAHKPCLSCMVRHADDWAADFVTRTFPRISDDLRRLLYEKLIGALVTHGVTTVAKSANSYKDAMEGARNAKKAQAALLGAGGA